MDVQISLGDLGILLLGIAFLTLIIYTILILKNLNDTIKVVKTILQDNKSNVDQVLDQAPSIAESIESISSNLSQNVEDVQEPFRQIVGATEIAASTLNENTDTLSNVAKIMQFIYFLKEALYKFNPKRK